MLLKKIIIFCLLLLLVFLENFSSVLAGYGFNKNLTSFLRHRKKRALIFNDGGSTKLVIGPVYPLELDDPIAWRSLLCLYNIHVGNYNIPFKPLYPWDKWENFYVRSNQARNTPQPDESREFLYLVIENYINIKHGNGRDCLLRAICENGQVHRHMDLFSEILNVILTPGKNDVDAIYGQAFKLGKKGADCFRSYSKCPYGLSFLDQLLLSS